MKRTETKKDVCSFLYIVQNACGKIWTESDMTDERIKQLKSDGCYIKSVAMGKKNLSNSCLL
jgi:hypothetical protein